MIYLDHNATTPCSQNVVTAMLPYFTSMFGNPASSHRDGQVARLAVAEARANIGALLQCRKSEVIFTSGATEANNLAILGAARAARTRGTGRHLIVCSTEHKAVLEAAAVAASDGFEVDVVPVSPDGVVLVDEVQSRLRPDTILCSVMFANNETGVVQPIGELARVCRGRNVLFHTDAAQAAGQMFIDVDTLGVDLLSLSAHKMYGPKGIGALYIRGGVRAGLLAPLQVGGGQERGLRGGTVAVPLVVGFGAAAVETQAWLATGGPQELIARREDLWRRLQGRISGIGRVSHQDGLPGTLMVEIPGTDASALVARLSGTVACSSGSACNSGVPGPSHVLKAMGGFADGALRLGLGRATTVQEVGEAAEFIAAAVSSVRHLEAAS